MSDVQLWRKDCDPRMEAVYIRADTQLVSMASDCYSDLAARILSTFSMSSPFMNKCQLPSESLRYLVTVVSNEDLRKIFAEREELNASQGSIAHLHLFVLPMQPSSPSNSTLGKMSGASIKNNVVERDVASNSTNSRMFHKRTISPLNSARKR